ncbi:MAG: 50S ribosomal protein L11 methyltransferase [Planctomycetota bacterium]|nr:MAG: 50S ribosomal protein L11 methyltransferase [Planctomycetota bacterium]
MHEGTALPGWTEMLVLAPLEWMELVGERLCVATCATVAYGAPSLGTPRPPAGMDYVRAYVLDSADTRELRALVEARIAGLADATGARELAGLTVRFRRLPPEDYASSWEKVWKPFRAGPFAVLRPSDRRALRATDVELRLEPGAVFGTGRHATTRLCLALLATRVARGERVLDAGTGTGLLAVAACKLGAGRALGFDIDPAAAPHALHLATQNGCADRTEWRTGGFEVLDAADAEFDGVLANIYSDILQAHAHELCERLRVGGWFVFSGVPDDHALATRAAFDAAGLRVETERTRGRWHAFAGRKPA